MAAPTGPRGDDAGHILDVEAVLYRSDGDASDVELRRATALVQHLSNVPGAPHLELAKSVSERGLTWREHGTTCPAVWAFEYGKGRVCYLAPGHTIDVMLHREYQKMRRNAVHWLLRESKKGLGPIAPSFRYGVSA